MPRKKKSFIDRKNSSTYHLVHRSQRDVGVLNDDGTNEALSQFVLMPSANNAAHRLAPIEIDDRSNDDEKDENAATRYGRDERRSVVMTELSDRLSRAGLTDDYDYDRHMRPVTGTGTFLGAVGKTDAGAKRANDARARTAPALEEELGDLVGGGEEVGRRLDSIALTPACMDDDVAAALFSDDFEAQGFEEILDDFVLTASSDVPHDGGEGAPPEQEEEEAFDFDAHVRRLMERAQSQARSDSVLPSDLVARHEWAERARAFFADARPLGGRGDDDDDNDDVPSDFDDDELGPLPDDGVAPRLTDEEERALVERFERTLLEYDDDDVGDLEEQCGHVGGDRPLEGDAALERALDEFLEEREDDVLVAGAPADAPRRAGGSGFSALVGNRMVRAEELSETAVTNDDDDDDDDANPVIPPELEPPEEDVLIDGKSYFSVSVRNPWDCESILSTYSNLDNNPVTVGRRSRRRRKKPTRNDDDEEEEEEPRLITLSDKTGLPTGVLFTKAKKERDRSPTSSAAAAAPPPPSVRRRGETAEEKRSRKQRVKEERRVSRLQKKLTKDAFKEEFQRVSVQAGTDDVGGRTVFRYS